MTINPFKNIITDDPQVNKLEQNVSDCFSQILPKQILDGVLVTDVAVVSGAQNLVSHKLQRKPHGFIVVKKQITTDIWMLDLTGDQAKLFIDIRTGTSATISLWVF